MRDSEAIGLYCNSGTSDKVYHMQLLQDPAGTWAVFAQSGRRGSTLVERKKKIAVGYADAKACYEALKEEKISTKGYRPGALSPRSVSALANVAALTPGLPPATALSALPAWPDLASSYAEIATMLGEPSTIKSRPQAYLVLLVDLADSNEEGLGGAVSSISSASRKMAPAAAQAFVQAMLSHEGLEWASQIDATQQKAAFNEVLSACNTLANRV